jgi:hypothetical protein
VLKLGDFEKCLLVRRPWRWCWSRIQCTVAKCTVIDEDRCKFETWSNIEGTKFGEKRSIKRIT